MLSLPEAFIAVKNRGATSSAFFFLFEVKSPTGGPVRDTEGRLRVLRWTENNEEVTYGTSGIGTPLVFPAYPTTYDRVEFQQVERTSAGLEINVLNAGLIDRLFEKNDSFRDHRMDLLLVCSVTLSDPSAHIRIRTEIVDCNRSVGSVNFILAEPDMNRVHAPKSIITTDCRYPIYRGPGCDFAGDPDGAKLGDSCARTGDACTLRGLVEVQEGLAASLATADHPRRFGGFLSLPTAGVSVT